MNNITNPSLIADIKQLIDSAKTRVALKVNQEMTFLYWNIGKRIKEDILKAERAEYGAQIIETISQQLIGEYGKGFSLANIFKMLALYESFPEEKIFSTLSRKLSWSHFVELLNVKDALKRSFYAQMVQLDNWSVRTLREKIGKMLYERTALAQEPNKVIENSLDLVRNEGKLDTRMLLQNPYILDFLDLPTSYNESELEQAILNEIQKFLLELGVGFCFVERQKRISVGGTDYYLDLLMYNRYLHRLVVIELKTTKFKPSHKGQMEFYLRWLDKHERKEGDKPPIGIILCTEKGQEEVELFDLDESGIHVAEYWTELLPKKVLEQKVHEIVEQKINLKEENKKYWDLDEEDE
jgi:predicted nuclease of restriction endonuclease-like (RecB) superfamily